MPMTDERKQELLKQVMDCRLQQDFVVLEDMHLVPLLNTEYVSQYFYIGLCRRGRTLGHYDYKPTDFKAGDICWLMPDHVVSHHSVTDDYSVLSVFITREYFQRLKERGVLGKYHYLHHTPLVSLTPSQFDTIYQAFLLLGRLAESDSPHRENMIASLIGIISTMGDEFVRLHVPDISQKTLLHEDLFERFLDAVVRHHCESREVKFYADLLALTPKYFATVIKRTTGLAASEWINRYVMVEAKWLLRSQRQKSIQQIALHLGFSEQASFSRFFKGYEGLSPREFRERE